MESEKRQVTYKIDCTVPINDSCFDIGSFEGFLNSRFKVNGKAGLLEEFHVEIKREGKMILITCKTPEKVYYGVKNKPWLWRKKSGKIMNDQRNKEGLTKIPKPYLRYLTCKFLKKNELRNWLHVCSIEKGYKIEYYNVVQGE